MKERPPGHNSRFQFSTKALVGILAVLSVSLTIQVMHGHDPVGAVECSFCQGTGVMSPCESRQLFFSLRGFDPHIGREHSDEYRAQWRQWRLAYLRKCSSTDFLNKDGFYVQPDEFLEEPDMYESLAAKVRSQHASRFWCSLLSDQDLAPKFPCLRCSVFSDQELEELAERGSFTKRQFNGR